MSSRAYYIYLLIRAIFLTAFKQPVENWATVYGVRRLVRLVAALKPETCRGHHQETRRRRQVAVGESGDKSPHSKISFTARQCKPLWCELRRGHFRATHHFEKVTLQ